METQVDGDKLAEAFRRVTPFMYEEPGRPVLNSVYVESHNGTLELTTTDGYRMAHCTLAMDFPEGAFILAGDGVKNFSQTHHQGQQIPVVIEENTVKMGDVKVALVSGEYPDYRGLVPDTFEVHVLIATRPWIKAIRQHKPEVVGVVYKEGCQMYMQQGGDTTACEPVPVQMFSGTERKVAYHAERLRRALTSCGASATIKVAGEGKTLFEATEGYWHLLMPTAGFPREVNLSKSEREMLGWAEEALRSIRKGEVHGKVMAGGGRFYLELTEEGTETEIILKTPQLAEKVEGL